MAQDLTQEAGTWGVNELGEVVLNVGTGSSNIVGQLPSNFIPTDPRTGNMRAVFAVQPASIFTSPSVDTVYLSEGMVLNISGDTTASGIVQRISIDGSVVQTWVVKVGVIAPIGPFKGMQRFRINTTSGNISAEIRDSSVSLAQKAPIMGNLCASFGDSLTAFGGFGSNGSATAVGNIATVTLINHGEVAGNTITLQLSQNLILEYHGVWKVATVLDKDNFTVILKSAPSAPAGAISVVNSRSSSSSSYQESTNFRLGAPFTFVVNAGIGSNTTDMMLARLDIDVIAYSPNFCIVMGGTNDIRYVQTTAARDSAIANLIQICLRLLASGITPVLCTILPLRNDDQGFSITTPMILAANTSLISFAAKTPGILLADTFAELVDNSFTDNRAISIAMTDSVHINNIGRNRISVAIANALQKAAPNPLPLVSSNADTYAYSSTSSNYLINPLFIQTGGTAGPGVTGTVASNYSVLVGGTATAVASIVPRTFVDDGDRLGNNQRIVVTAPALDDSVKLTTLQSITQFVAGDELYFDLSHAVRAATNIKYILFDLSVVISGQTYHQYIDAGSSSKYPSTEAPFRGVKRSLYFKLPGNPTSVSLTAQVQFDNGGGSATVDFGRMRIGKRINVV